VGSVGALGSVNTVVAALLGSLEEGFGEFLEAEKSEGVCSTKGIRELKGVGMYIYIYILFIFSYLHTRYILGWYIYKNIQKIGIKDQLTCRLVAFSVSGLILYTLPKFNSSPLKSYFPNRKVVFQPPFFRDYVKLQGCEWIFFLLYS